MNEGFLDAIVGSLADPIVVIDRHARIFWSNRAFAALAGPARVGEPLDLWLRGADRTLSEILALAWGSTNRMPFRAILGSNEGETCRAEHWRLQWQTEPLVAIRLFDSDTDVSRFVLLNETIDRLNKEIKARRELENSLRSAVAELELANDTKKRILAEVSHDLRTPLNAILGFAEAMQCGIGGTPHAKHAEYLQDIRASGQMLLEMVDQILKVAELGNQTDDVVEVLVDLGECIRRSVAVVSAAHSAKNLTFLIPDEFRLPKLLAANSTITTILSNLLENAAKFSEQSGQVQVEVERKEDGGLCLQVVDGGPGISKDDLGRISAPFFRSSSPYVSRGSGYGLGLSIVASRVSSIDGRLDFESAVGMGTRAMIHIPSARVLWLHQNS
ncbi:ATP-binding protein [Marinibaculum pumilum]|uniref:histidine kinase n=1 Tax=Marinibaculum pumilum TaxID=1766165 RepID=A0ABV7KW99_9PROT